MRDPVDVTAEMYLRSPHDPGVRVAVGERPYASVYLGGRLGDAQLRIWTHDPYALDALARAFDRAAGELKTVISEFEERKGVGP